MAHTDPLAAAPQAREFTRRNVVRLIRNEIVDMPLTLKQASGIPANEEVPFWQITYEALDLGRSDGSALTGDNFPPLQFGTKLYDKNGDALDRTQPPFICAQAFGGLGVTAFPESGGYTGEEIGDCFVVESTKFAPGRELPIPVERL